MQGRRCTGVGWEAGRRHSAEGQQDKFDKAADELTRAYMGGGIDIFMEDDPRYLAFLETRISL
jgi:hypothetical protein